MLKRLISLISLISAGLITLSMVGCQSTQEISDTNKEQFGYTEEQMNNLNCSYYHEDTWYDEMYGKDLEYTILYDANAITPGIVYSESYLNSIYDNYKMQGGTWSKDRLESFRQKCVGYYELRNEHLNTCIDDTKGLYKSNNQGGITIEEQTKIWCPMCQEDTIDMDTHECEKCGYIPEDWQGYLMELGLN